MQNSLSSNQVAAAAGLTLRQLQWWDEHGVIKAQMQGHARRFSRTDAIVCSILGQLRRRRFSLQGLRASLPALKRCIAQQASCQGQYLVVSGKKARVVPRESVVQTLSASFVASYVLDLQKIAETIDETLETP